MIQATKIMLIRHAETPDDRFDLLGVFDRDPATGAYGFEQVASGLLDGDLPTVIS